jgi:primosomal protein N' (replication factor Y)
MSGDPLPELFPAADPSTPKPVGRGSRRSPASVGSESPATTRASVVRPRFVRVLPDIAGIDKQFDYFVPPEWVTDGGAALVRVGSIVRIDLHGRRVGGWVVEDDVEPPEQISIRPLAAVTGLGPPPDVVDLASYIAWRWFGRARAVLRSASPDRAVRALPPPLRASPATPVGRVFRSTPGAVVRIPPVAEVGELLVGAPDDTIVVTPTVIEAQRLAAYLRRSGRSVALLPGEWAAAAAGGRIVIGARAAVLAPVPRLGAIVVVDEHDEGLQEERMPTWHARDVALERARRAGVPCVLTSPVPSPAAHASGLPLILPSRRAERESWPLLDIVDRREDDTGRAGLFAERIVGVLRGPGPVVCVVNRTGRARLLTCKACGSVARCEHCDAAVVQLESGLLHCPRCATERPVVCAECGASTLGARRLGVSRARDELEALARRPVVEVVGPPTGERVADADVYVGTEAVLYRLRSAHAVVFLDFDQELTAPRYRAVDESVALLIRAARLLGGRRTDTRLVVQTRQPDHPVLQAVLHAEPGRLDEYLAAQRRGLRWPPYGAVAEISGAGAAHFVESLARFDGLEILGPVDDRYLLRAPTPEALADSLSSGTRPSERLRVAVDPPRV